MQKGLVSILTPCYNTGKLLHRLLDSVLMQDYPQVEMFCIDDGSSDNTREVVESYIPKFAEKGYTLTYVYQENGGQSVAVNNGLKLVNGEYLMWPDSDDYYAMPDIISCMVAKMQEGAYDMGRCRVQYVDEKSLTVTSLGTGPQLDISDQFDCIVYGNGGIAYPPIGFILRMKSLDETIPNREIYTEKRAGQNWQLMMPLSYRRKMFFLDEVGASVLVRGDSHSRGQFSGYAQTIVKINVYERTILGTLDRMQSYMGDDYSIYYNKVTGAYTHGKFVISILAYKQKEAYIYLHELEKRNCKISLMDKIACLFCLNKYMFLFPRLLLKLTKAKL